MPVATETKAGTKIEEKGRSKVSPDTEVKVPTEEQVSAEDETPIYSQKQADALLHAERSEHGRRLKEVERERDSLKSQISTFETELEDNKTDITSLEKKIGDLSSDDPARFDAIKELKAAREERRQLKIKLLEADKREASFAEREKRVTSFEREVLIESIADEYEDGDAAKLKKAVSKFENSTEEQIRIIADSFWKKKEEEGKQPPALKLYSGKSAGGGKESLEELLKVNVKKLSFQARLDHKRKLEEARTKIS